MHRQGIIWVEVLMLADDLNVDITKAKFKSLIGE